MAKSLSFRLKLTRLYVNSWLMPIQSLAFNLMIASLSREEMMVKLSCGISRRVNLLENCAIKVIKCGKLASEMTSGELQLVFDDESVEC